MKDCKKRLNQDYKLLDFINITEAWLKGFIEGDGCFSTSSLILRLKFKNHIKELKLIQQIKNYLDYGSIIIKTKKILRFKW